MSSVCVVFERLLKVQAVLGLFVFLFILSVVPAAAQENRSYSYDSITFAAHINGDTTIDVVETQTYRFIGEYHQGWRSIPQKGFDELTDVSVVDVTTGQPLTYTSHELDKTQASSWNKYTTFSKNGESVIEWYYNASDTVHSWALHYTVHGALAFYQDHDEWYWNLLTSYAVPVRSVDADIFLPQAPEQGAGLQEAIYVEGVRGKYGSSHSGTGFHFFVNDLNPGAKVTIAPGWPKGLVDAGAYQRYWWWTHWGLVGAGIIILLTLVGLPLHWYFTERFHTGRGTIVPEYEPPTPLPPAMADVLIHEKVSSQAWAATVIDLAVRGFILIKEEKQNIFMVVLRAVVGCIVFVMIWLGIFFSTREQLPWFGGTLFLAFIIYIFPAVRRQGRSLKSIIAPPSYALERTEKEWGVEGELQDFERAFLKALFKSGRIFSFKEMKKNQAAARKFYEKTQKIKKDLLQETAGDTGGYEVGFQVWWWLDSLFWALPIFFIFGLFFFSGYTSGAITFLMTLTACGVYSYAFIRYNPRLNRSGQMLKEEWLGFKMYLETAERYRLQNLTPETFEKFLPYAIIFGVEKEWGKAFAGLEMIPPHWYAGSSAVGGFSASSFSSSFSASFVSSFASSGGGGASGGGGSAGGGGGGGGGGAS